MRGWIIWTSFLEWSQKRRALLGGSPRDGSGRHDLPAHDPLQLVDGAPEVVVHDHVVELVRERELGAGRSEPLLDLPAALRGSLAQPPLELGEGRRADEDRHRAGHLLLDREGALRLQVEQRYAPLPPDPRDLAAQRADALAPRVVDVLDERVLGDELGEALVAH